jgi:hypothetical protein
MGFYKKAQASFNGGTLGVSSSAAHRLPDKLFVNFDVRPHELTYV